MEPQLTAAVGLVRLRACPRSAEQWRKHAAEYYAPKNFNFWYYFGSLAMLVLVIQIVTGIFLTMNYKPDAAQAFGSVEYIMRDVPWRLADPLHALDRRLGVLHRASTCTCSAALLYGSYRKPRELVWIFGVLIYLAPDGRGVLRLPAALGPDVLLGRAGDRQPVRRRSRSSGRTSRSGSAATTWCPTRR